MNDKKKIKVLVVDDSIFFRETISRCINEDPMLEVVGTASDPYQARDRIIDLEPDIMLLDVQMPGMSGIEFLKRLMPQYPIPVVVVSGSSSMVFDALKAGAADFVVKPDFKASRGSESFIKEILIKLKIASTVKLASYQRKTESNSFSGIPGKMKNNIIIAIGASTGGTEAIYDIIKALPVEIPGIVIVQHMPPVFTKLYAQRLNNSCALEVKEAQTNDIILPGKVLIAQGDSHMRIRKSGSNYFAECFKGEKVNGHCPSVDVLFESVAECAGKNSVGIILTGMGYDGAKGLLKMRKKGARTIGQDEKSSIVYGMPKVAYDINAVEQQAPPKNIPAIINSLVSGT